MESKCLAVLCVIFAVSAVHHATGAENVTIGTVTNKPWSYTEDGKQTGLAVDILMKIFEYQGTKDKFTPQLTEDADGVIGRKENGAWTAGLIKDLIAQKDGMQMGAAGVMITDDLEAETKLMWSMPYLTYNVSMLMEKDKDVKSIMDGHTNNMTFVVVKDGPIHVMFTKCETLLTDATEKTSCKAINDKFTADATLLVKDAAAALKAVKEKDSDMVFLTDGATAKYHARLNCELKVVDGGMFPKGACKYAFPINKDAATAQVELKPAIDATIKLFTGKGKDDIKTIETTYLSPSTCGSSGLSFTLAALLLSVFVSKLL
ncbi:uncharacterized protein LOC135503287 [Lineus longissimus]|uniref:uncharacterized protein LOC135503287 n=1 Tax=Lineus longissimus TaxID=88925 RepID=UPI002B4C4455